MWVNITAIIARPRTPSRATSLRCENGTRAPDTGVEGIVIRLGKSRAATSLSDLQKCGGAGNRRLPVHGSEAIFHCEETLLEEVVAQTGNAKRNSNFSCHEEIRKPVCLMQRLRKLV